MKDQYSKLVFGIISLLIGIIFLFKNKKIIEIQGKSKEGDYSEEIRIQKLKVAGVIALIGGIFLILQYLLK